MTRTLLSKESFMSPKLNCGTLIRKPPTLLIPSLTSPLNLFLSRISLDCAGQEHQRYKDALTMSLICLMTVYVFQSSFF